jgi:hypothetical protein
MIHAQDGTFSVLITDDMTNSATQTANLDTQGADYATLIMSFAKEKNTNGTAPTVSLLESDDTVVTNFATFDSNFELSGATFVDLTAAAVASYYIDLKGRKRYLRLSITTGGTSDDDIECHAVGYLTRKGIAPTSTSDMSDLAVIG